MGLDPTLLMLSLIPSGIGFVLFMYGRKAQRWPQIVAGLAFMVYPYFTGSITGLVTGGVMVSAALYFMLFLGW